MAGVKDVVTAGGATAGQRMEETEKLLRSVRNYAIILYLGSTIIPIAPKLAMKFAPRAVAAAASYLSHGYDVTVTVAVFTAATLIVQGRLARVLERPPVPAPRLTPLGAWPLAVGTWMCMTAFFLTYLTFGDNDLMGPGEWAAAGVASAANLAMAVRTVSFHLA